MKFDIDYIEKLAQILESKGLTEISLEEEDSAITLRKEVVIAQNTVAAAALPINNAPAPAVNNNLTNTAEVKDEVKKGTPITSPMVGTFYKSPSPDAAPFVNVGSTIKQGDVVCIVEAMKMMNEIKSEISGTVTEICVEDGQPVEFGQVLMYVE